MEGTTGERHGPIDQLADEMFRHQLRTRPLYASQLGYTEHIAELPDLTPAGQERQRTDLEEMHTRAAAVSPAELGEEERITRGMLLRQASDEMCRIDARAEDYTVTPIPQTGLAASVIISFPKTLIKNATDAEAYLERCTKVPGWLEEGAARLAEGTANGRQPVHRLAVKAAEQLTDYLTSPLTDDPLVSIPAPADGAAPGWRDRLIATVRDQVRPAMEWYRDYLVNEVVPSARPDHQPGLAHLPEGTELYRRLVGQHTTTDRDVGEIHRTGLELVEQLTDEMRQQGEQVLGTSDFPDIKARLRTEPEFFFADSDELVDAARDALSRAQRELPNWLGLRPEADCVVTPMTPFEVENGDLGHYQWPTRDHSRPGTYWINADKPQTRPRFQSEVLAFHESVPGHHTQLALSQELPHLSEFRRHAHITAFSEGWALYTERLADEMGLYTSDLSRLGTISFDFWRACRLVVDTGMHAMGWERDRAVNYMVEHSALTRKNIENEVDRYIGWPGQALGYMLGRLEIRRLRAEAEQRLGKHFVLRDFHSALIGHGSLPLSILDEVMQRWIKQRAAEAVR